MKNGEGFDKNNKIDKFKEKYIKLVDTLKYDEQAEENAELEDGVDELSVYEMRERSVLRTEGRKFCFCIENKQRVS